MNTQQIMKRLFLTLLGVSITLSGALILSNHLRSADADNFGDSHTISLESGWNDIGFMVETNNTSPNNLFTATNGFQFTNNDLLKDISDGRFAQFYNGMWEGSLTSIDHTHGFRIDVQNQTQGTIYGDTIVPEDITFQLDEGWNALPFYGPGQQSIEDAFASIEGQYELIKSDTSFCEYVETLGCLGSLSQVLPGRMYQILMFDDADFSYGSIANPPIEPPTYEDEDLSELLEDIEDARNKIGAFRDIEHFFNLITKLNSLEQGLENEYTSIANGEQELSNILEAFRAQEDTWKHALLQLRNIKMDALDLQDDINEFIREHNEYNYFEDEEEDIEDLIDTLENVSITTVQQIDGYDQDIEELEDEVGHKMDQFYLNEWVDISEKELLPLLPAQSSIRDDFDEIRNELENKSSAHDLAQASEKISELFDEIDPETLFLDNEKEVFVESIQTDLQALPGDNNLNVLRSFINPIKDADDFETLTSLQEDYYEAYNSIIVELETLSFTEMKTDASDWADHMYIYATDQLQDEVLQTTIERYQRAIQNASTITELEDIFVQLHIIDQELLTRSQ